MFPFPASQAIALKQAMQKSANTAPRGADANPPVQSVRKGLFRRILDAFVESRRRKAELEIATHRRLARADMGR
jgi:hypothetical protein